MLHACAVLLPYFIGDVIRSAAGSARRHQRSELRCGQSIFSLGYRSFSHDLGWPMPRRLPPLNALKAFEAAARHESFTRAAEELCVTQGAVSHQVKGLEA